MAAVVHQKSIEENFVVGKCYECVDEVKQAIESYNRNNFALLKDSQRSLYKHCPHSCNKRHKAVPSTLLSRSKKNHKDEKKHHNRITSNISSSREVTFRKSSSNSSSNNTSNMSYSYNSKYATTDLNSKSHSSATTTTSSSANTNNKQRPICKNPKSHKACQACNENTTTQRCGDEALKLTKAYKSLLRELDNLENESLKGIDKELVRNLKQANAQLWQINSTLIKKKKKKKNCERQCNKTSRKNSENNTTNNSKVTANDNLSLDALEKFLGNLIIEAEEMEIEKESDLQDKDKYKMVMPVLIRIGKMVSHHPTKQFLSYHEHLGKLEKAIKVGQRNNDEDTGDSEKDSEVAVIEEESFLSDAASA